MFFHNFKYCIKTMINGKVTLFWTLIFPIALATFMYMAMGNLMEKDEMFKDVKVALVEQETDNSLMLTTLFSSIKGENDEALIELEVMDEQEAQAALNNDEVCAVIYSGDCHMDTRDENYKTSTVKNILDQYLQNSYMYKKIAEDDPDKLSEILGSMWGDTVFYTEEATTDGSQDRYNNYFFAIFAMSCLFASFSSLYTTHNIQGNVSALGMRRNISATGKLMIVCAEYAAMLFIHFVVELITLLYMKLLGVDIGHKYPAVILTLFVGCMIGIAMGVIIGSIRNIGVGGKLGIAVGVSMALSVMADLCVTGLKNMIEMKCPVINRINPAALITDCFYTLNVYDNYNRFTKNIVTLVIESVLLVAVSILIVRRNKYASV